MNQRLKEFLNGEIKESDFYGLPREALISLKEYYEALKDNVGDEYTLCYDDDAKCTSIKRGYLMEGAKW